MQVPLILFTAFALVLALFLFILLSRLGKRMLAVLVPAGILLVLCLVLFASSVRIVNATEALLIKEWGNVKEVKRAGFNTINVFSQTGELYNLETQQVDLSFQAYSKDAQAVDVQMTMQYTIDPARIPDIARQFGSQWMLSEKLSKIIEEKAKVAFSSQSAMTIIETRSTLSPRVQELVAEAESDYYIGISNLAIVDISFSSVFENAVEQKMLAEQEKLRAQYDKEKAIIKAEEQLEVARRQAESVIVQAEAEAQALREVQKVWAELSPSVIDAILRSKFYENWDGVLPSVAAGDGLSMILDPSRSAVSASTPKPGATQAPAAE
ncbi:MAG: prohibitin family protein [Christensenellaceae bacterium]|jgi:regulator of protease activity HflC (stomatin/prohibitin superfamily)|nr:prohibitin family protein [Christensenellaceae bacterium]